MKDAEGETVSVRIGATLPERVSVTDAATGEVVGPNPPVLASGRTITFLGFLRPTSESRRFVHRRRAGPAAATRVRAAPGSGDDQRASPRDQAAGPLHRTVPGGEAGGVEHRASLDVCGDHPHDHVARLRVQEGFGAGADLAGVRGHAAAGGALREAGRLRVHRRDGTDPRRDRRRRCRPGRGAQGLLLRP